MVQIIATLFNLGTESSDELIATMYDPLNSRWQEDIASQINAIKNARLKNLRQRLRVASKSMKRKRRRIY